MANPYTVCLNDAAVTTLCDMTHITDTPPIFYYDTYGCSVEEQFARYSFTCTVASDEPFRIYYYYDVVKRVDGDIEYTGTDLKSFATMPAGATQVYRDVLLYTDRYCGEESSDQPEYQSWE